MRNMHMFGGKLAASFIAALALFAGCAGGGSQDATESLRIYTWSDYISPHVLQGFEAKFGVRVVVDTFDSNETMYARLKSGAAGGYDIIMPSSYQIDTMAREGMIDALDHAQLPNVRKNFDPSFAGQILDPSFTYSVPYAVTYTGFAYLKDKIPEGADVASWSLLGNEAFRGRITLLDDMREVIGGALVYLGYSANSKNPEDVAAAVRQVLLWRENVRTFDATDYKTGIADGAIWIAQGYSTDIAQMIAGGCDKEASGRSDIGFALPREGFVIAFDEMVVCSGSRHKDIAHAFIDYMYNADVAAANMRYVRGPMPVAPAMEMLDDECRALVVLDDATLKNGQVLRSFDEYPEVQALYLSAWNQIKATESR